VGDAVFTCRPRTYLYQASDPLVVVSSTVPVANLPAIVRRLDDLPIGLLPHSPLVDAVVDLLLHLSDRLDEPWGFDADYAARGLLDLETAILTEVIAPDVPVQGPDRVYTAAVDYIERHLGEPHLRPPQIAEALGVSLRYLHRAFDDKELTVARLLRERRLEQVANALRSASPPPLSGIATRYGFASQDQLARAFRRRYGMSMTEYRATDTADGADAADG
jgi:AraC-like DNA-binding protein